jgi:hypothetical protein
MPQVRRNVVLAGRVVAGMTVRREPDALARTGYMKFNGPEMEADVTAET